jgi:hypothetical protein
VRVPSASPTQVRTLDLPRYFRYLTPAIIGTFWGAPLISRELETGTYRLAWT